VDSGWSEFRGVIRDLLLSRGVVAKSATLAADDLQAHCQTYLFYRAFPPAAALTQMRERLQAADTLASTLYPHIRELATFTGWTRGDRDALVTLLARFVAAAHRFPRPRPRRGRPADINLRNLADGVAETLLSHGIAVTKARTGTFALVLEQVDAVVGLPDRDVHKAVRTAADRAVNRVSKTLD
jgi:hypothetical protein